MKKLANTPNLINILVGIHPRHKDMLIHYMQEKGAVSMSDVVRQAIVFLHDKTFPDYVYRETAAGSVKREKIEAQKAFEAITDEEFCRDTLKSPIVAHVSGKPFTLVHTIGNSLIPVPVEGIKDYMQADQTLFNFHMKQLEKFSVESKISDNAKSYLRQDGIVI